MGFGSNAPTSLAAARSKALASLKTLKDGRDPLAERQAAERVESSKVSFGIFADEFLKAQEGKFRNAKHAAQWKAS